MKTITLSKERFTNIAYVIITCIVFLTTLDLAYGFAKQSVIALICSTLSGLIVFLGAYLKKKVVIEKELDKTISFLEGNFNGASIALSILDIVCCIIAVITSTYWFATIFRIVLGARVICITNKIQTILRPFKNLIIKYIRNIRMGIMLAFTYLFYRFKRRRKNMNKFKKFFMNIKNNYKNYLGIVSSICTVVLLVTQDLMDFGIGIQLCGFNIIPFILIIVSFILTCIGVCADGVHGSTVWDKITAIKKIFTDAKSSIKAEAKTQKKATKQNIEDIAIAKKLKAKAEAAQIKTVTAIDAKIAQDARVAAILAKLNKQ